MSQLPLASPVHKTAEDRGRIEAFITSMRNERPEALILNIGSGTTAYAGAINLDVDQFDHVQAVGDALSLPVLDGVLDGVITQGVLEHVASPWQAVAEIKRALRPGGLTYNEVPFVQGDHSTLECPDFWRFTQSGTRALFEGFDLLDVGIVVGPGSGITWLLREYLSILVSIGNKTLYKLANRFFSYLTLPLKFSDAVLSHNRFAAVSACAFYVIARKPEDDLAGVIDLSASQQGK